MRLADLLPFKYITIQCHDNPDADTIASGYAIYMYYGAYDVPIKGSDKAYQDESEEVYQYLILAISPVDEEQIPHSPEAGFLYPAFTNRSTDINHVNFYSQDYEEARELMKFLNLE